MSTINFKIPGEIVKKILDDPESKLFIKMPMIYTLSQDRIIKKIDPMSFIDNISITIPTIPKNSD